MTGDVRHSTILSWRAPRRNPLRRGFHTVCVTFASPQLVMGNASPILRLGWPPPYPLLPT